MLKRTMLAFLMLASVAAVAATGQDDKKLPPFELNTSGDTVETFKADFKLHAKLDQSSAEAVVTTYDLLTDNRAETAAINRAAYGAMNDVVAAATKPMAERLLSAAVRKTEAEAAVQAEADVAKADYQTTPSKITKVSDGASGAKLVETYQKATYKYRRWDSKTGRETDEWEDGEWETTLRYTCVKGDDGKWRISGIDMQVTDWDAVEDFEDMDNLPTKWEPTQSRIVWHLQKHDIAKPAELKQDTAQNAALSLFDALVATQVAHEHELTARLSKDWLAALKGLLTPELIKAESATDSATGAAAREVESITEGEDGITKVRFKPRHEWCGGVEIHVKKTGDAWQIVAGGFYPVVWATGRDDAAPGELQLEKSLRNLSWR